MRLVLNAVGFRFFASATLVYSEIWRKGKTMLQAIRLAPVTTANYHARAYGYMHQVTRHWLGFDRMVRVHSRSKTVR